MPAPTSNEQPPPRVIEIGLFVFGGDPPVWWIGYMNYHPDFTGITLSEVDANSEFGECFEATECIETHPPDDVAIAISRALEIAKAERLPLYRVTNAGPIWDCRIYEELYTPE